jgi:hypothetical protein
MEFESYHLFRQHSNTLARQRSSKKNKKSLLVSSMVGLDSEFREITLITIISAQMLDMEFGY